MWRTCFGFLLTSFVANMIIANVSADDDATLDRYLQRLGLTDLRLYQRENALESIADAPARTKHAHELADLYAERLLLAADEPQRFREIVRRVSQLIEEHPSVDSPQLQVMLIQADYQQAEALALKAIDDSTDEASRTEAIKIFGRVTRSLARHRTSLSQRTAELQSEADRADETMEGKNAKPLRPATAVAMEKEMARVQQVLTRAAFFDGWANLLAGLLSDSTKDAQTQFVLAQESFSQILELGLDAEKFEFEAESMGLESVWRSRTLLGLAAALSAAGKEKLAGECFAALDHASTAPAVRETSPFWHLLALVRTNRWPTANELAANLISRITSDTANGKVAVCVLLVRTGWDRPSAPDEALKLSRLGIEGLARLKQFDVLGALLVKYRPEPKPTDGFYALWCKGKLTFADAEKSKASDDFAKAASWFAQALDAPEAEEDLPAAAQCRYSLAWCDYRRESFEAAATRFQQAAAELKTLGDNTGPQAAWMAFTCYQQLQAVKSESRYQEAAIKILTDLRRDFPDSIQAQRAELALAKLNTTKKSPDAAIKAFAAVPPDSASYLSARFDLAVARHQQWREAKADQRMKLASLVRQDVDTFLAAAPENETKRRVASALLAIDVTLSEAMPDWARAAGYLDKIASSAQTLADSDPLAAEFHYRCLQEAQHAADDKRIREESSWLAKHAGGSPYELSALIALARWSEDRVTSAAGDNQKKAARDEAIAVYSRLVKLLGDSTTAMAAKKNTLVANARLAQYEFEAGQFEQAANRLEKLVAAAPKDRALIHRAALAWLSLDNHTKALPHWHTLLAGSESASDAWYEAKYYQIVCLRKIDPGAAEKAWKQFKLLHPQVKSVAWQAKFAELATDPK